MNLDSLFNLFPKLVRKMTCNLRRFDLAKRDSKIHQTSQLIASETFYGKKQLNNRGHLTIHIIVCKMSGPSKRTAQSVVFVSLV